jgi:superkiller protein 3
LGVTNQGRFEEVLSKVKPLIGLFPKAILLFNIQGAANGTLQNYDEAIESYKKAIQINPDYAEAFNNMGIALKDKGDLSAAIDSYKQAFQIKPDHAEAHLNLSFGRVTELCRLSYEYPSFCAKQEPQTSILEC